ncbi:hypothetical protein C8R45DRAFT_1083886 [Mycena sanguinolenta]|nr:hypothetical protein C8R45DRAFT_1083886 [Mycena sanguinolenta]
MAFARGDVFLPLRNTAGFRADGQRAVREARMNHVDGPGTRQLLRFPRNDGELGSIVGTGSQGVSAEQIKFGEMFQIPVKDPMANEPLGRNLLRVAAVVVTRKVKPLLVQGEARAFGAEGLTQIEISVPHFMARRRTPRSTARWRSPANSRPPPRTVRAGIVISTAGSNISTAARELTSEQASLRTGEPVILGERLGPNSRKQWMLPQISACSVLRN